MHQRYGQVFLRRYDDSDLVSPSDPVAQSEMSVIQLFGAFHWKNNHDRQAGQSRHSRGRSRHTAFPIWAQWLPILLQIGLGGLGFVYLLMRMYRERLLIKWAQRRIDNDRNID